jgi:bifunctional polynucleotide phosphatase/kinase
VKPVSQTQHPIVEWSNKFGPTCLFGTVGTCQSNGQLALFDLDQTLIDTQTGNKFPRDSADWRWLSKPKVPEKLQQLHKQGLVATIELAL